jgi:hypothetical protein
MVLTEIAAIAADIVVFFHFLYVLFAVGGEFVIVIGGFFHWRWVANRIFRFIHLAAVLFVSLEAIIGTSCPLTELEYLLRDKAGQMGDRDITFVGRLIRSIIFYDLPPIFFTLLYVGFGALVLLTFFLVPPKKPPKKREGR